MKRGWSWRDDDARAAGGSGTPPSSGRRSRVCMRQPTRPSSERSGIGCHARPLSRCRRIEVASVVGLAWHGELVVEVAGRAAQQPAIERDRVAVAGDRQRGPPVRWCIGDPASLGRGCAATARRASTSSALHAVGIGQHQRVGLADHAIVGVEQAPASLSVAHDSRHARAAASGRPARGRSQWRTRPRGSTQPPPG